MAQFGAPNFLSVIDAYEAGSRRREKNALAELDARARELTGAAVGGNKNALAELFSVDPDRGMQVQKFTSDQKRERLGEFLSAAYGAKTPEQWQSVVQRFKAQGHEFGPGEDVWENRENLIRQGMSVADQMGIDLSREKFVADSARDERNFSATQDYRNRSLAIQQQAVDARSGMSGKAPAGYRQTTDGNLEAIPGGPADPKIKNQPKPMTASMLKLKRESESSLIDIGNTRDNLRAALALVGTDQRPGDVMSGFAPETRAFIGNTLPDAMVPDQFASPRAAAATKNYSNIMNLESIQRMASTLKGATTDFELNEFVKILSDPSAPNSIKRQTIQRMMKLADAQEALERQRLEEFGGQPEQNATPTDQQGSNDTQQENADFFIQQANDAIAAGADPEAVMQRLRDMGVDTEFGQ